MLFPYPACAAVLTIGIVKDFEHTPLPQFVHRLFSNRRQTGFP